MDQKLEMEISNMKIKIHNSLALKNGRRRITDVCFLLNNIFLREDITGAFFFYSERSCSSIGSIRKNGLLIANNVVILTPLDLKRIKNDSDWKELTV